MYLENSTNNSLGEYAKLSEKMDSGLCDVGCIVGMLATVYKKTD
jgi:hypothetical protein